MNFSEYCEGSLNEGTNPEKAIKNVLKAVKDIKKIVKRVEKDADIVLDEVFGGDSSDSEAEALVMLFSGDSDALDRLEGVLEDYEG